MGFAVAMTQRMPPPAGPLALVQTRTPAAAPIFLPGPWCPAVAGVAAPPQQQRSGVTKINKHMSLLKGECIYGKLPKLSCNRKSSDQDIHVMEADESFELMRKGASIMRYGDGELRLMDGYDQINHGIGGR